jgi:poly(glycerol-phosphate) alpha-glucosyltransferase
MSQTTLPAGTQYALTVNIPENYGGMTASMLQRSRAFVQHAGAEVTILTYDHDTDYEATRARLRDRGSMVDGMHIANMWEHLRAWDDEVLRRMQSTLAHDVPEGFRPLGDRGMSVNALKRELLGDDGQPIQIDYFRPDGTLLVSDQRWGTDLADRRVVLCDSAGNPLGSAREMFPLYTFWFDQLPRNPVAWIIVESKSSANMMLHYQRPDVALLHVVRGSHLKSGPGTPVERELVGSRAAAMLNLDAFDSVVFLTNRQRSDIEARFGPRENIAVIPNSRNMPATLKNLKRRPGRGVMLASLDGRKRIGHAVRAMARVRQLLPRRRVRLDVWGQGPLKAELEALITKLRAPVVLRGHAPQAADEFARASFSLLTSRGEALPGVVLESMGRGCIPVSYDMPYGPSDIITHGVDGFLVPNGDIDALTEQIRTVVTLPQSDLIAMREAAFRRGHEYSDKRAVERWADLMSAIASRRGF